MSNLLISEMSKNTKIEVEGIITRSNADSFANYDHYLWQGFDRGLWDWHNHHGRIYHHVQVPFSWSFSSVNDSMLLNFDAWVYGFHRKIQIELEFYRLSKRLTIYDYEACVSSGCYADNIELVYLDRSGKMEKQDCCNEFLQICKDVFGVLPPNHCDKYNYKNPIGNCAEQHVVNGLISSQAQNVPMKISLGVRPRTMLYVDNCENCKAIMSKI